MGLHVGNTDDSVLRSGITAVLFDQPAVAAVDVSVHRSLRRVHYCACYVAGDHRGRRPRRRVTVCSVAGGLGSWSGVPDRTP